jgi:hypothetical protein
MIVFTITNIISDYQLRMVLFAALSVFFIGANLRYIRLLVLEANALTKAILIVACISSLTGFIQNILITPNLVRFLIELSAVLSFVAGCLYGISYSNRIPKLLSILNICFCISLISFLVYIYVYGLSFSSQDLGRVYLSEDSQYPAKNLLILPAILYPFYALQQSSFGKLLQFGCFLAFIVASVASGGRSALLILALGAFIACLQYGKTTDLFKLISLKTSNLRIKKGLILLLASFSLVAIITLPSLLFIADRSQKLENKTNDGQISDVPIRIYETQVYLSDSTLIDLMVGRGVGSITSSPLFLDKTPTLHLSLGHIVFKSGFTGLFIIISFSVMLITVVLKNPQDKQITVGCLALLCWAIFFEIPHTTLMDQYVLFIVGTISGLIRRQRFANLNHA